MKKKIQFRIFVLLNFQAAYSLYFKTKCSNWRRQRCAHSYWFGTPSSTIYRNYASKQAKPRSNNQKVRIPLIIFLFVDVKLLWSWYCSSSKIWRSITYMARIGMLLTSGTTLCYWKLCKSGSEEGFVTIKTQWWKLFFHFLNRKTGMIFYNEFAKSRVWCSFSLPCHVFGLCTQGNIHA